MATVKDHLDMYGPTSIQKIEYESYLANLDIFQQFDHGRAEVTVGEGKWSTNSAIMTSSSGT